MNTRQETAGNALGDEYPAVPDCAYSHAVPAPLHDTQADRSDEVPTGYKQTEVGVIPSDWSMFTIGELFEYLQTASNSRADLGDTGVVAYVHYGDIHTRFNHFIDFSRDNVPRLLAGKSVTATRLRDGDLIVADASEDETGVGKSVEVRNLGTTEAVSRLHTLLLRPRTSRLIHDGYRAYLLEKEPVKRQLRRLATGLKVFGISKQALRGVRIPLPSPTEQRNIAEALSDVDRLLATLELLIAKKQVVKQATMQQLLTGKTRLPGFQEEWTELNMARDSLLKARIGWQGLTTAEYLTSGDYYLVTGTDFDRGRVDWTSCFFVDHSRFIQDSNIQLAPYDVLLTKDGTIGKAGFIDTLPRPATLNSGIFVIRPKAADASYIPKYMYYVLTSRIFDGFLTRLQAGSTITHLYQKDFVGFTFKAPQIGEQRAIAAALSDMDAEITALERRRDKTSAVKQGLMQQLITGQVRLIKPDLVCVER